MASQVQALVDEFNRSNSWSIQVSVSAPGSSSELFRLVNESMGKETRPDVVVAYPEQVNAWQASGKLVADLSGYLSDPMVGLSPKEIEDFTPPFWNIGKSGSQQLGIPAQGDLQFLLYNQTWAKELGFSVPPASVSAFQEQACKAAGANRLDDLRDKHGTGGWLIDTEAASLLGWLAAFGGDIDSQGQDRYIFKTPEGIASFTYLKQLFDKGCAWLGLKPDPYGYFVNRYALFYAGSLKDVVAQEHAMQAAGSRDRWTVIPFPSPNGRPAVMAYGALYSVIKSTPPRQLAGWLFIRWLSAPDQQVRLVQARGTYPLRDSVIPGLVKFQEDNPHWTAGLTLLSAAHSMPQQAGWLRVRGILQDAAAQIFQPEAKLMDVPSILDQLDRTAAEFLRSNP